MTLHIIFYVPYSIFSRQFGLPKPCVLVVYVLVARKYRDFKKKKKKRKGPSSLKLRYNLSLLLVVL